MQYSKLMILGLVAAMLGACGMPRADDIQPQEADETSGLETVHPVWLVDSRIYILDEHSPSDLSPTEVPQFVKVLPQHAQDTLKENSN